MRIIEYKKIKESFFKNNMKFDHEIVNKIIKKVNKYGDSAVKEYTKKFDKVILRRIRVEIDEIERAFQKTDPKLLKILNRARLNIKKFSQLQLKQLKDFAEEITSGVIAEQRVIPINRIGIYVPGGRYPLVSTVLMCGVPAMVAGVGEIVLCSPPTYHNTIHPMILATAKMIGIKEIYKVGGVQAIAAMAYGTATIRPVDKIFGPGNAYVVAAKKAVYGDVGIDFIAGPSEILIIADASAEPEIIAADLLSQAEHDVDAIPVLVTDSSTLAKKVSSEIKRQLVFLRSREIAEKSLNKNGLIILVENIEQAIEIANKKAPEHLEIQFKNANRYVDRLKNYGSLFVGRYSAEVLGDYCAGINHTLPTNSSARYTGGLHIKDFLKIQTVLKVTKRGLESLAPVAEVLSRIEGLNGHTQSLKIRRR
ncbi:MAG: histidinol dehydrogenase [bacterium]